MARQNINVGAAPNDGQGDPIRTAYTKTNNNFIELYNRAQTNPPATLIGSAGDEAGMYAYDSTDFYWCFQNYDGSSVIWAVLNTSGNVSVTGISSGTSNVNIAATSGPVTVGVGGVANVAVFATTGANITGALVSTGNITGSYILGNGSQLTGLPATYGNANVADYLPTYTGNLSPNIVAATGNISGANVATTGLIVATGNVTGGNLVTGGVVTATGNANVGNLGTAGLIVATGNVTGGNLVTGGVVTATGNANVGNLGTSGLIVATGNVTGGNLVTAGKIDATGNITTAGFFIGTFVGNITGNLTVPGLNTEVLYNNAGNAGADSGFAYSGGIVTVVGNVAAGNLTTGNAVIATGNVTGGNLTTAGIVVATGNVTGGNLITAGVVSATGNANVGNLGTAGLIVATGNITGGNLVTSGNVTGAYVLGNGSQLTSVVSSVLQNGTSNVSIAAAGDYVRVKVGGVANVTVFTESAVYVQGNLDVTGNTTSANLNSNGVVSGSTGVFSGNVAANYFTGNGSLLTGLSTSSISNGTSNVVVGASGNVTVSSAGTANVLIVTATGANISGTLNATGNANVGNIDATTGVFTNISGTLTTAAQTNITSVGTLGSLSVTGNASTGNVSGTTGTFTNVIGTLTTAAQTNITSVGTLGSLSVTGNISAGNLGVSTGTVSVGNIVNTNANGVGNIGTSTTYFNTVFAQATSAQYADLAENYRADNHYEPGTVVKFGGSAEITQCNLDHDPEIAGIVSTNPAYIMNAGLISLYVTAVALAGRVPCKVQGRVRKGQMMVSAGNGWARAESHPNMGTVIGKALEDFDGDTGTIEVVVGRL